MNNKDHPEEAHQPGAAASATSTEEPGKKGHPQEVQVHCDYISADHPIHRAFSGDTILAEVKKWARETFVPDPPSGKAYYLNDDKTRHRFTEDEEHQTLHDLGYEHSAHLRLNEEQASGSASTGWVEPQHAE